MQPQDLRLRAVPADDDSSELERAGRCGRAGVPRAGAVEAEEGERQDGSVQLGRDHPGAADGQDPRREHQRHGPATVGGVHREGGVDQRGVRPGADARRRVGARRRRAHGHAQAGTALRGPGAVGAARGPGGAAAARADQAGVRRRRRAE